MSIASREAEACYPPSDHRQTLSIGDVRQAYKAGRAAPVTGEEIEAVARLLFSLHPMTMTERNGEYDDVSERARHHYQSEARWLLNEARLAVQLEEEQ